MFERLIVFLVNIFFPPLAVLMVAGVGTDVLMNTLFFLLGVIPGHIHGFYITCTYFHRKSLVRNHRWPGGKRGLIYSKRVLNGDASSEHVRFLWDEERRREMEAEMEKRRKIEEKEMKRRVRSESGRSTSWGWLSSGSKENGNASSTQSSSVVSGEGGGPGRSRWGWGSNKSKNMQY